MTEISTRLPAQNPSPAPGCFHYGLLIALGLWAVVVSVLVHGFGWFTDQLFLIQGLPFEWYVWPIISWGQALLIGVPVLVAALFVRVPRFRAVYQTWALAAGFIGLLALVRALPATSTQTAALAQIVFSLMAMAALLLVARAKRRTLIWHGGIWVALALALLIGLPWLAWGALGSLTDTALDFFAALSLGLFGAALLGAFLFGPITRHSTGPTRDLWRSGLAASVALLLLGSGFGFNGSQLLLMIVLPPLGLMLAALFRWNASRAGWALAVLIGLVAAAPLMLIDPDEMALILGDHEIMQWAFSAAAVAWLLEVGLSLALVTALWRIRRPPPTPIAIGAAFGAWLVAFIVYAFLGQPGFYGEQLFVILKDQADLSPAYQVADRNARLTYVYQTLTQHAEATQADLRKTLDVIRADYHPYYLVNALEVNGGALLRLYLAQQPEVDRVIDSPHLRPLPQAIPVSKGTEAAPTEPQWNITSIGADRVWQEFGVTGAGIIVGQSDSGVDGTHPALAGQYRGQDTGDDYNWLDPWNDTRSPTDIGGHGTHTLGSIVGQGGIGVAPGAQWFGCVNLARNLGNPPLYLTCMQFMLAPYPPGGNPLKDGDPTRAAHVINDSWGCPPIEGCDAKSLQPAVEAMRAAGVFVVASAGNEGPFCHSVSDPIAIYDSAFSVGAVDKFGTLAQFSSRGPVAVDGSQRLKPDIAAPGDGVLSSTPGNTYATFSGTSMAGPHVVGAVALLWSANPALIGDIDRTEQILRDTARPYTGTLDTDCGGLPNAVGAGLLDVYAAVQRALEAK